MSCPILTAPPAFLAPCPVSFRAPTLTTPLLSPRHSLPVPLQPRRSSRPLNVPCMQAEPAPAVKRYKRLVVLSDGTWQTLENEVPTNILNLSLCIDREDDAGIQQVVFYDPGVGTNNGIVDQLIGGAVGNGIDKNIKQLYTFLALNYEHGDEIYVFGFSRGAYTVRSLVGMIHHAGLTRRDQVQFIKEAYDLYRNVKDPESQEALDFRKHHGSRVPIKLLMCFDTVGALGMPFSGLFFDKKRYQFHDTALSRGVENAIHCVSLDEDRKTFQPTRMDHNEEAGPDQLTQLFFWGGHGGVGGGDLREPEQESAKAALLFLIAEMERRGLPLQINKKALPDGFNDTVEVISLQTFSTWIQKLLFGKYIRKVGSVDEIHPSAKLRYQKMPEWRPASLKYLEESILEWHP